VMLMDSKAIRAMRDGKKELSLGYSAEIEWKSGTSGAGEQYDAVQKNIRANHLALVDSARGGPKLRIGDADDDVEKRVSAAVATAVEEVLGQQGRTVNQGDKSMTTRSIVVDGVTISLDDTAAAIVQRFMTNTDQAVADARKKLADAAAETESLRTKLSDAETKTKAAVDAKDGEIVALKKQVADATKTPEQLDRMVKDRFDIIERARKVLGDKLVTDGKTDVEVRRAVVAHKLGDQAAKDLSDAAIEGAFAAFTTGDAAASTGTGGAARLAASFSGQGAHSSQDAASIAYDERNKHLQDAWKSHKVA
jgi:hypothetical protein